MDIYALGQIIQWYVTGYIHRGTARTPLTESMSGDEVRIIDLAVNKCLANTPSDRFQSVEEMVSFINMQHERAKKTDPWQYIYSFNDCLAGSFPKGLNQVSSTNDQTKIRRLLTMLSRRDFAGFLEWSDGKGNSGSDFTPLENDVWLMGNYEIKPREVWVYFDLSQYTDFIIMVTDHMPGFGFDFATTHDEAGLVDNEFYISRNEYDSGYA